MKTYSILLLALMLVLPVACPAAQIVPFDDTVLEEAIRGTLNIPDRDVTARDMEKLTKLSIGRNYEQNPDPATQVKSVEALVWAKNLKTIDLAFQHISDISPLAKLKKLTDLNLGGNPIGNISALEGLTNLEILALFNCQAQDYTPLAKLKKLRELYLDFSTISDLSPLAGLKKLQNLGLVGTPVTDVTPLVKLSALRTLKLKDSSVSDFMPLEKLYPKLKEKDFDLVRLEAVLFDDPVLEQVIRQALGRMEGEVFTNEMERLTYLGTGHNYERDPAPGTRVQSIQALTACKNLEALELNFNNISDISPLAGLTMLTTAELGGNPIQDVNPLAGLINIQVLKLFNCQADDYAALANLVNLKELYLELSTISDLSPLSGLSKLETLALNETAVTRVEPLQNLTSLRVLMLSGNSITDFRPLKTLAKNLVEMDFDPDEVQAPIRFSDPALEKAVRRAMGIPEGEITTGMAKDLKELYADLSTGSGDEMYTLDDLKYFIQLENLSVKGQPVSDISPLEGLKKLKMLNLEDTNAQDISVLAELENLEILNLRNTPVDDLTPIAGLGHLFGLHLSGTQVQDFSSVKGLFQSLVKYDFPLAGDGMVQFTDAVLEERVRRAMGKGEGGITQGEAKEVTALDLSQDWRSEGSIRSLAGLQWFTGLETLSIAGNRGLRNLSPLDSLPALQTLDFCWCDVRDVSPLQNLVSLRTLIFGWGNRVENLDALHGLVNLEAIDAKDAGIMDVSGLANLPKLFEVQLCNNEITDVTPFATLPGLRLLLLKENPITDFSPLNSIAPTVEKDF